MPRRILVIAPHPDDETLGAGGTLLKMKDMGYETFWVIFTKATEEIKPKEWLQKREKEIKLVAKEYGFSDVFELGFTTTRLDMYPMTDLVESISKIIKKVKPAIVFLNHPYDIHSDHRVVFQACASALKSFRADFVNEIFCYETLSETEQGSMFKEQMFLPNTYVDITRYFEKKREIMSIYESEIDNAPFPRSFGVMEALARLRGSFMGTEFAEAFVMLRRFL